MIIPIFHHETQDCLPQLHRAADATAKRWNGLRLVYATMAYGQRDVAGNKTGQYQDQELSGLLIARPSPE